MTKTTFMNELAKALCDLPAKEKQNSLDYISEMIDDRIESGMEEESAVKEIGSPRSVAREMMLDLPLPILIKAKCRAKKTLRLWEIILLALGSPVWLSLCIALLAVVLSVYVSLWAVFISIWAVGLSLLATGLYGIVMFGVSLFISPVNALLHIGLALVGIGAGGLVGYGCFKSTKVFVKASFRVTKCIKNLIVGKEKTK